MIFLKKHKKIIGGILVVAVLIGSITFIKVLNKSNEEENKSKRVEDDINDEYRHVKAKGNLIKKSFDGSFLNPIVTLAEESPSFKIEIDGLKKDDKPMIINTFTGDTVEMKNEGGGKFSLDMSMEVSKDYAVLLNNRLIGATRVVPGYDKINVEEVYNDAIKRLTCAF
ncbi:hypothetical protein K5V21_03105 [Clostridium sardiniense]|uniref:Uncharacterized protein n=1 Tax=Clostridium sardiniense TaxID=29369 RepID=A0ABS7KUV6_CLOSR|nr:hypothetical protein [Clostridium sardiniense]MBY0754437.1 hypothetical protein [Clostridium sardiniense]MDQ0461314.1 hypothetical protein [Clostridium sardiniense]